MVIVYNDLENEGKQMITYGFIEGYSGYIWGIADGDSPQEALRRVLRDVEGSVVNNYKISELYPSGGEMSGFYVYKLPRFYEVYDGQNQVEIDEMGIQGIFIGRLEVKENLN